MFKKKQLLPKDLADRAEKVNPRDVEAEVLRIISAKPQSLPPMDPRRMDPFWPGQLLQAGSMVPVRRQDIAREAELLNQLYSAQQQAQQQQPPWFPPLSLGL